jgi:hypothetical protein
MPAKYGLNFLESCKKYKYFIQFGQRAARGRPAGRAARKISGSGMTGRDSWFFNFTGQGGPWHGVFWQGGPGQWELTGHNALHQTLFLSLQDRL